MEYRVEHWTNKGAAELAKARSYALRVSCCCACCAAIDRRRPRTPPRTAPAAAVLATNVIRALAALRRTA